ncbi:hypothetical protein G3O08_07360 [Cryomorpha ignava]|uniref:GLPGLI family protein n=1 Tax=Cryomorpha ignava TaxID=101383 RepID=A0A7K3WP90_9FLAO|nr:hypothetical protein [Cryomorpha ignava]NEN23314.1 hypothetical protein [Cryomorpha ignava]
MKKFLIVLLVLAVAGFAAYQYFDESPPSGKKGEAAEALADKMLSAIGKDSWDAIPYIQWTFKDARHYVWDKQNDRAEIKWDDNVVKMNLDNQSGSVTKAGEQIEGEEKQEALEKAWGYWCNDSFWLNAPAKIRDSGTMRSIVKMDDGTDGLLVEYTSGGVTPGDAYLWALDEAGLPIYYKMWVSIIPVGGMKATWGDWKEVMGAKISTSHDLGSFSIPIGNLKAGKTLAEMGLGEDFFEGVD